MADAGGLQLLPETRKKLEIKIPGENRLLYIGSALIAIVLVFGFGIKYYNSRLENSIADLDNQLKTQDNSRNKEQEGHLLVLSKQLALYSKMFADHIYWSQGLNNIANNLQNQVQFKTLSAGVNESKVTFRAVSSSYTAIARQIASFASDSAIKDISLDNINSLTNGTLEFSMTLNFDANKFIKTNAK